MLTFYYFITHGLGQFVILPFWWYGSGLVSIMNRLWLRERDNWRQISIWSWLTHFFVPMFHDYTIVGRGLSIVFRFFIIIFKIIRLLSGVVVRLIFLATWMLVPLVFIWGVINYFGHL